jgi:hypothetical protein
MKAIRFFAALGILLLGIAAAATGQDKVKSPGNISVGFLTGYNRGYGLQANLGYINRELPFELRGGVGYTFLNPGNALEARRVFINNNTNGTPEKSGRSIDYRFDFLIPKSIFGIQNSFIVLGPRGSSFKGNFAYIGGNEEFDVVSRQWGIGGGLESRFKMSARLNLVIAAGLDYYFPSTLLGHDTAYSPDNDNVNPRDDNQNDDEPFTYKDADKIIYQPRWMPYGMVGLRLVL